jgi:hypothetical protein
VTQALEQVHGLVLTPGLGDVRAERRKPKKTRLRWRSGRGSNRLGCGCNRLLMPRFKECLRRSSSPSG